jgi:hypothetical protein
VAIVLKVVQHWSWLINFPKNVFISLLPVMKMVRWLNIIPQILRYVFVLPETANDKALL